MARAAVILIAAIAFCGCSYSLNGAQCGHGWGWHCSAAETRCFQTHDPDVCAFARAQDAARYAYAAGVTAQGLGNAQATMNATDARIDQMEQQGAADRALNAQQLDSALTAIPPPAFTPCCGPGAH